MFLAFKIFLDGPPKNFWTRIMKLGLGQITVQNFTPISRQLGDTLAK